MKIYLSHSRSQDYERELYEPLKASDLVQRHRIFFPHDSVNEHVKTKDIIKDADLVIAEVSLPATGQGIELGWADAAGTPIVCMSKANAKISGSLHFVTDDFIEYTDATDMINGLQKRLSEMERA